MDQQIQSLVAARRAAAGKVPEAPTIDRDAVTWGLALAGG